MSIWRKVEESERGIQMFMDKTERLHDYKLESIRNSVPDCSVEVFLKYDTDNEGILLKFEDVISMRYYNSWDCDNPWLLCTTTKMLERGGIVWFCDWVIGDNPWITDDEVDQQGVTYVKAHRVLWAVTDGSGNPVDVSDMDLLTVGQKVRVRYIGADDSAFLVKDKEYVASVQAPVKMERAWLRVTDESGNECSYPRELFELIEEF